MDDGGVGGVAIFAVGEIVDVGACVVDRIVFPGDV